MSYSLRAVTIDHLGVLFILLGEISHLAGGLTQHHGRALGRKRGNRASERDQSLKASSVRPGDESSCVDVVAGTIALNHGRKPGQVARQLFGHSNVWNLEDFTR